MTDTSSESPSEPETQWTEPIIARAGQYYRNTRYLMCLLLLGYGLWSIRDGFYKWPEENAQAIEKAREEATAKGLDPNVVADPVKNPQIVVHPGWDIPFNRVIGIALPPLSVLVLVWSLRNSRGEYRLEGNVLNVPGHPPVPFENITELDQRLWEKKGIAYIGYDLGDGRQGTLRLDDFVYERPPTDEIYKRIEQYANPRAQESEA